MSGAAAGWPHFLSSRCDGNAAIEFALIAPVLICFLVGIVCYGGYFWLAHNIQELANDSARAAIGGLTSAERQKLAQQCLNDEIGSYDVLKSESVSVRYVEQASSFTVSIVYDASNSAFFKLAAFLPMPSSNIARSATVRLGGF